MPLSNKVQFAVQLVLGLLIFFGGSWLFSLLIDKYGFYAIFLLLACGIASLAMLAWVEYSERHRQRGTHGTCRYCGCTEDRMCKEGCDWADKTRTCCTAPLCMIQKAAGR